MSTPITDLAVLARDYAVPEAEWLISELGPFLRSMKRVEDVMFPDDPVPAWVLPDRVGMFGPAPPEAHVAWGCAALGWPMPPALAAEVVEWMHPDHGVVEGEHVFVASWGRVAYTKFIRRLLTIGGEP